MELQDGEEIAEWKTGDRGVERESGGEKKMQL